MGCTQSYDAANRIVNQTIKKRAKDEYEKKKKLMHDDMVSKIERQNSRRYMKKNLKKKRMVIDVSNENQLFDKQNMTLNWDKNTLDITASEYQGLNSSRIQDARNKSQDWHHKHKLHRNNSKLTQQSTQSKQSKNRMDVESVGSINTHQRVGKSQPHGKATPSESTQHKSSIKSFQLNLPQSRQAKKEMSVDFASSSGNSWKSVAVNPNPFSKGHALAQSVVLQRVKVKAMEEQCHEIPNKNEKHDQLFNQIPQSL